MEQDERVEVEFINVTAETEKARLFLLLGDDGIEVEQWIPKSQHSVEDGILTVAKWLVDKNNL